MWRSYDYPHVIMLYYHMYEIAMMYPQLSNYLDAAGYLERAYQTAKAFYVYPYEIYPEYYETYKWGLYNELIVLELIVFTLENRAGDAHETELSLHLPYGAEYELLQDGKSVEMVPTGDWDYPWRAVVRMSAASTRVELIRADQSGGGQLPTR